ncbi:MAG: 5'/3'-nucleotidase SurE [Prevotella sp.]|jgi:5'-nucleotidase|nr:5'/3'-nucleotidase SurE [Prevotella sp.]
MEIKRPLLLISNDDGYLAKGINCLVEMLSDLGDIIVCAPEDARSGFSCAFSATVPLRLQCRAQRPGVEIWSCTGTPVDCVKMALAEIVPRTPDLVIGGINHGDNASVNAHYSGTMGVTLEGCMKYIPSVAFSLCDHREDADFEPLRPLIHEIIQRVLHEGLPLGVCLNVNFPLLEESGYKGVRVCRMAKGTWGQEVTKCHHPRGYDYWWMVGSYTNDEPEAEDTDNWALTHGYVAITPTQIDITAYQAMDKIKSWGL